MKPSCHRCGGSHRVSRVTRLAKYSYLAVRRPESQPWRLPHGTRSHVKERYGAVCVLEESKPATLLRVHLSDAKVLR